MSADKRSVTTDALATLGTIIESGGRDAIHLAVEPVVAGEPLSPGQDIGLVDGKAYAVTRYTTNIKALGIVDPFLLQNICEGQKFWLIVYPRQITSLRHVWTHPDFENREVLSFVNINDPVEVSKAWIIEFAHKLGFTYDRLMDYARRWADVNSGSDYTYDNSETYKSYYNEFPAFWNHYEVVTKEALDPSIERECFFTCSC